MDGMINGVNAYDYTLFQRAKIERYDREGKVYNGKLRLILIAENVPVGLANNTSNATAIQNGNGNTVINQTFLLHTRFSNIKAGDVITVGDGITPDLFGVFDAAKPYPVMDQNGVHHYEVILVQKTDA
ncbi:hypothetical protein P4S83_17750 [Aneurinibacillus thermoaerophilus]|uniref:hypothetical protein n=1 Tax=Aneurinibacillus thermoaerophilus TaxID=143495 RepID=UPI002E220198|nr:hypothetical protein [Aneurinibacillus thermoaerophilus]MED0765535.1 hypothetical protein [Aneurinibacillus thermoaerophilus]